jgi:pyrroline-5-carboxylate reductase
MSEGGLAIVLVGGGKMGGALARGWRAAGLDGNLAIVEPDPRRRDALAADGFRSLVPGPADLPADPPAALVLAVKPQVMDGVLAACRPLVGPGTLVVSIAAGKPIAAFERAFGPSAAVVRAMPNTPAAIGRGASVLCANAATGQLARELAARLLAAVGTVDWVDDEDLMHAVTALSGSGPAYAFLLMEAMAAAGARLGLPGELAARLARRTVCGAGELAATDPSPPADLRRDVTSPGGTTRAALDVLTAEGGLGPLVERAMTAAARRSRELADA